MNKTNLLIGGIRVPVNADEAFIFKKAKEKMKRAGIDVSSLHFRLYKKSVDARKRDDICFACTVQASTELPADTFSASALQRAEARIFEEKDIVPTFGNEPIDKSPLVVGMGPAGLFSALLLAQNGYSPILIDRGGSVEERTAEVARFREKGILNTENNVQFGAGGAGTFSDGKLITRINDERCGYILRTLVRFGAPEEILVKAKPHVGTDVLRTVVSNILSEIERLGGTVRYHCRLDDIRECADGTVVAVTSQGDIACSGIILALGHSARDTYAKLIEKEYAIEPKPISVGVRVEHLQADIDRALYGSFAGHPALGPAEYSLSDTKGSRGVYTFCMCPGGEVVAAASEEGHLVVNGMSYHARNNPNANAAVAVSIGVDDYEPVNGSAALGAIAFQRRIERAAFLAGGGNYVAPIMTMGDFLSGKTGSEPTKVLPSYRDGMVKVSDFEQIFPSFVTQSLRYGLRSFGRKLVGYDNPNAILTAAETRTSAPLRILRSPDTMQAIGHTKIYPCGEGAGYAGGITSAAVDGLRVALSFMQRYAPL